MNKHIFPLWDQMVTRQERQKFLHQRAAVFWITGLSGAGKTTLAKYVERQMFNEGYFCQLLDGDNIRAGINNNLSFSQQDRTENIRRLAEIAKLYLESGIITFCSFISPTNSSRNMAKEIIGDKDFYEVYIKASVEECEKRDVKGLYNKARAGEIKDFTGISSPYEPPQDPAITIDTDQQSIEQSSLQLYTFVRYICQSI